MRRKVTNRNIVRKDHLYQSEKISKFINYIMKRGQKETARKIDQEKKRIIDSAYSEAFELLQKKRIQLEKVANVLLEKEELLNS